MTDAAILEPPHIGDYLALLRREKWRALAVGGVILAAGITVAAIWPPTYRSTATILIEEADTPPDLVASTVSALASERIRAIQQRVITSTTIIGIINKFNLYAEERKYTPIGPIADQMRANIDLSIINADPAKSGRDTRAAISFTISYDGNTPRTTQQVTSELASLFLSESQRDRHERTTGTTSFLEAESNRLQADVARLEAQLETFRTQNAGYLPEDRPINQQLLDRAESQLLDLTRQIRTLRERQGAIRAQIASTSARLPVTAEKPTSLSPSDQLALLQAKRMELSARYGAQHPDVLAFDRQIKALMSETGASGINRAAIDAQVAELQAELQKARQKYGSKHPDTERLQRELTAAQQQQAAIPAPVPQSVSNPVYLELQVALASANSELEAAVAQQQATEDRKAKVEERIFKTPQVERDYVALKRDYDTAVAKYLDVRSKQAEAELTQNLESRRMGETLTLVEPAVEPLAPIKPNRRGILAIAILGAMVGGIVTGLLHDAADGRIHGGRQLANIAGQTPFAIVPYIRTARDRRRRLGTVLLQCLLALLIAAAALLYVDRFIEPLDVMWADVAERMGLGSAANASSGIGK